MNLTAWVVLGVILAIALFFWSLPFWAEPRQAPVPVMSDDHWLAIIFAAAVLGMFFLGYGVAFLQWEALS